MATKVSTAVYALFWTAISHETIKMLVDTPASAAIASIFLSTAKLDKPPSIITKIVVADCTAHNYTKQYTFKEI